MPMLSIEYKLI